METNNKPSWNEVIQQQKERIREAEDILSMMVEVHAGWSYIRPSSIRQTAIDLMKRYPGWSIEVIKEEMRDNHSTLCNVGTFTDVENIRNYPELFR